MPTCVCGTELQEKDRMGASSFACPACGKVVRPGQGQTRPRFSRRPGTGGQTPLEGVQEEGQEAVKLFIGGALILFLLMVGGHTLAFLAAQGDAAMNTKASQLISGLVVVAAVVLAAFTDGQLKRSRKHYEEHFGAGHVCKACKHRGPTFSYYVIGKACKVLFLVLLPTCTLLCWLPFVISNFKDQVFFCKKCQREVGRLRWLGTGDPPA